MTRIATRIRPDSRPFVIVTAIATLITFAAAFAISGAALVWTGEQLGLPGVLPFAMPAAVDGALLSFALGIASRHARGESTLTGWLSLGLGTAGSVAANVAHGLTVASDRGAGVAGIAVAVGSAILIPSMLLASSHSALSVLVAPPTGSPEVRKLMAHAADASGGETSTLRVRAGSKAETALMDQIDAVEQEQPGLTATQLVGLVHGATADIVRRARRRRREVASA